MSKPRNDIVLAKIPVINNPVDKTRISDTVLFIQPECWSGAMYGMLGVGGIEIRSPNNQTLSIICDPVPVSLTSSDAHLPRHLSFVSSLKALFVCLCKKTPAAWAFPSNLFFFRCPRPKQDKETCTKEEDQKSHASKLEMRACHTTSTGQGRERKKREKKKK